MKRKSSKTADLLDNLARPPAAPLPVPEPALPRILEYKSPVTGEMWRVQLFELFQAEFSLPKPYEKEMACFHEVAEAQIRGWMMARMVYGITPVILADSVDPKEMEAQTREEVCGKLGIDGAQLQAEFDALRALHQMTLAKRPAEAPKVSAATTRGELVFNEDTFRELGFSESIFDVNRMDMDKVSSPRPELERKTERAWFIRRVCEWQKMLEEPMVSALVRQALMNELYLRRLETEVSMVMPGTEAFGRLQRVKKDIEESYQKQLEEIKDNFPDMNVRGKHTLRGALSDCIEAYREYKKDGTTFLADRMRTAHEIDIELRQSEQKPEPQYRLGLNIYWIEAMHGLMDPNFRTRIPQRVLKKMDAAGRAAIEAARQELDEPLVDLERGVAPDEGSQFPDLVEEKK